MAIEENKIIKILEEIEKKHSDNTSFNLINEIKKALLKEEKENCELKKIIEFKDVKKCFGNDLEKKNIQYYRIGDIEKGKGRISNDGNYLGTGRYYKYIDLDSAIKCLKERELRFSTPAKWQDKYENEIYKVISKLNDKNLSDIYPIYAYCVTNKKNNEAVNDA